MARPRGYQVSCLNIRVHTKHSPEEYIELWKIFARARTPYVWPSSLAVMIGESVRKSNEPADGFFGHFYRFIQLDKDAGWFNIEQHKPAEKDDLEQIKIPSNLQPNLRMLPYYFDVVRHRLYFISKDISSALSPGQVERLLKSLAEIPDVVQRFGVVDIQIATEIESVENLLRWPVLRNMYIMLERPNSTDFEDDAAVLARLTALGARREKREYLKADEAQTLVPDDEMRDMAAVAADNGKVHVEGVDPSGVSRSADSQDYPWKQKKYYNPQLETLIGSFLGVVRDLFSHRRM
jgi:hypothetical protein